MRMMERNKSKFFYALYKEKVPKTDEYGNVTGEYEIIRDKHPTVRRKRKL